MELIKGNLSKHCNKVGVRENQVFLYVLRPPTNFMHYAKRHILYGI